MRRVLVPLALVLAVAAGCRRKPPEPSPQYERALGLYQQLYASELDDAYGDPRMDDVVAFLRKVDGASADALAAKDLLGTIERGRASLKQDREAREKMAQKAVSDLAKPVLGGAAVPYVPAAAAPDAGPGPEIDPYGPGASVAEINAKTGGCLVQDSPFREEGSGKTGSLYKLSPYSSCREKLPGFIGQAVMVIAGRIYRRVAATETRQEKRDGGTASAGPAVKAAPEQPPPPGARLVKTDPDGTRHYEQTIPAGGVVPGAKPPPPGDGLTDATPRTAPPPQVQHDLQDATPPPSAAPAPANIGDQPPSSTPPPTTVQQ